MILIGDILAGLTATAIVAIGLRFLLAPASAMHGYGIAAAPTPEARPWLAVKGVRDIVSGLLLALVMAWGPARLVGAFMLVATLIPLGDMAIVLRTTHNRAAAFGIHGATAALMVVGGALLLLGTGAR